MDINNNQNVNSSQYNIEQYNIEECNLDIEFINQLKPSSFKYKNGKRRHYGFIHNDIKKILDDNKIDTNDFGAYIDSSIEEPTFPTVKALRYEQFISPIVKAIQQLYTKQINDNLRIASLEENKNILETKINSLEEKINKILN